MSRSRFTGALIAVLSTPLAATAAEPAARTELQTTSSVPADADSCLDHSVKELGMSAKRQPTDRVWKIGPQFLHPSIVPDGTVAVRFDKGATASTVRVTATWPGPPKAKDVQVELQSRLRSMAEKMTQLCGVIHPVVSCQLTPAQQQQRACAD